MSESRILTSHVGSLVRPPEFTGLLREKASGRDVPGFDAALRAAVGKVVQRQVQAGVDIVSDGEFGKGIGWEQYADRAAVRILRASAGACGGSTAAVEPWGDFAQFIDFYAEMFPKEQYQERPFRCTGPISYTGHAALQRDIDNLKAAVASAKAHAGFLPVVAPASATALCPERVLQDRRGVHLRDRRSAARGVQGHHRRRPVPADRRRAPAVHVRPHGAARHARRLPRWARLRVDALNHALRGIPEDRIRYHICWGSWNGPHTATCRSRRSSTCCSVNVGGYSSRRPTRATSTSGGSGRT